LLVSLPAGLAYNFALAVPGLLSRPPCDRFGSFVVEESKLNAKITRHTEPQSPEIIEKRLADFVSKLNSYQQSWKGSGKRQCPGPRDQLGFGDQDSMSQRPPASRPASRSPPDGQRITLPPVQLRDDPQQRGKRVEVPQAEQGRGFCEPSSQALPSPQYGRQAQQPLLGEEWRPGASRDLGVHSILNPSEPEGTSSSATSRRVSVGGIESPRSTVGPSPQYGTSPSSALQHNFPGQQSATSSPTQTKYNATFPRSRHILTPRSPRAVSMGRARIPGTIDATQSPFLISGRRIYTAETDAPPMPTPPAQNPAQQHYGFPAALTPARRDSGAMQAPGRTPLSASTSPSLSQSSSQTSPASFPFPGVPPPATHGYYPGSTFAMAGGGMQFASVSGSSATTEGPYSAPPSTQSASGTVSTSSRQTSAADPIQVLTITTSSGIYNVPVDVHQASRLADEKRARNAGASARFRQRRKEREREANQNQDRLQQQIKNIEQVRDRYMQERDRCMQERDRFMQERDRYWQEKEWYRHERDRLRGLLLENPAMRHLAMSGPPSPRS
jgi:hypothetical protein